MIKLFLLMSFQSAFLVGSQLFLKNALIKLGKVEVTFKFLLKATQSLSLLMSIVCFVLSAIIWMYVLKKYDFNVAYPLVGLSYLYALFLSKYFFNEEYNFIMLMGTLCIVVGMIILMYGKTQIDA